MEELTMKKIKHPRKVFSRIGLSLFVYFIAVYASVILLDFLVSKFLPDLYFHDMYIWIKMVFCQYIIGIPAIRLVLIGLPKYRYQKEKMSFKDIFGAFLICQALAYAGNMIGTVLNQIISTILGKEIDNTVGELIENSNPLILLLVIGIIGPILEELVFRKFIIDRIRPYGEFLAVLFSALTFGMFHGNFYQLFYAFAIGFVLAFIYVRTKNIIYPVILHIAFNTYSVVQQSFLTASKAFSDIKIVSYMFTGLYYLMIGASLALTVLGVIKLIKSIKKFYFLKNYYELSKGKAVLYSLVNAGMIMFSVTVLVEFALSIFM
ncbi:MAG: CPBP family intramembrane metalloprotease [Ruminococcaceae bacterium]|nr:CPBP family intramembrane metalloprotease [Oscillospiraceae bacterium]